MIWVRFKNSQPRALLIVLLGAVLLLSIAPSVRLLIEAVSSGIGTDSALDRVIRDSETWWALWHSLFTAGVGTVIAVVFGTLFACVLTLSNVRAHQWLVFCFMLPMMIPPQVTALAWIQLFGPSSTLLNTLGIAPPLGASQPLYSPLGIALLLGIQHAPLVFLAVRNNLLNLPRDLVEAARINRASPKAVWLDVILPLTRSGLIAGAAIAFVSALGNFGIPAMLGIPASYYVLPTLIYQHMAGFGTDMLAEVSVLSMLIAILAMIGVGVQQQLLSQRQLGLVGHTGAVQRFSLGKRRLLVESLLWCVLALILLAPLVALLDSALVPALGVPLTWNSLTGAAFVEMLTHQGVTLRAMTNSLLLASAAAIVLMAVSVPLAYLLRRLPSRITLAVTCLIEIPYAVPGVVLAIAMILLFVKPIPCLNISLYGTLGIIFLAYLARFLMVALKPVGASLGQLDSSLEEAAQLAGASQLKRLWTIILPLVAPAVFAGGLLVFLIAVNELTVSALLWSAGNETLGVLVFNLDESGDSVMAAAISVVIVIMVVVLMLVLNLLALKLPKGVIPWRS